MGEFIIQIIIGFNYNNYRDIEYERKHIFTTFLS